jgi:hypothetical protein
MTLKPCSHRIVKRWLGLVAIGTLVAMPATARAQFTGAQSSNRGTTTSGMFGQTTVGGTSSIMPQGSRGGTTSGGMGGTSQMGAAGGMSVGASTQMVGMENGLPLQRQAFVGSTASNTSNLLSLQGAQGGPGGMTAGRLNFGTLSNLMNRSRQNTFNRQQAQRAGQRANQPQSQFPVPLRLGFAPNTAAAERGIANGFVPRLNKIVGSSSIGPISATLEGNTAVLRGTVASEADRQLAEGLAMLEPQVMAVRNELVVNPSQPPSEPLPPTPAAAAGQ